MIAEKTRKGSTMKPAGDAKEKCTEKESGKGTGPKKSEGKPGVGAAVQKAEVKPEEKAETGIVARVEGTVVDGLSEAQLQKEFKKRIGIIQKQIDKIQQGFLVIAFQLHWIKRHGLYQSLGYRNIYEFAETEYGIGRSSCGNFICIVDNYAEHGENGEIIESLPERYQNFTAYQLIAMLGMPEESRKRITPDMSVRLITRIKKQEAQAKIGTAAFGSAVTDSTAKEVTTAMSKEKEQHPTAVKEETPTEETKHRPEAAGKKEAATEPDNNKNTESISAEGTDSNGRERADNPPAMGSMESGLEKSAEKDTGKKDDAKTFNTLLSFNSFSNYQKEQERIHALVEELFKQSRMPVTVRIVYERGIA